MKNAVLKGREHVDRLLAIRFVRFLAVGVLNTAFGYSLFLLLFYLGLRYPVALLCTTVVGVLFNFKTMGRLVFASRDHSRFWRFILVYAVVYGVNVGSIRLLTLAGASVPIASALTLLPTAVLGFLLNRSFVFTDVQTDQHSDPVL